MRIRALIVNKRPDRLKSRAEIVKPQSLRPKFEFESQKSVEEPIKRTVHNKSKYEHNRIVSGISKD